MRTLVAIGAIAVAVGLATPLASATSQATPDQAFAQLKSCLRHAGALKVVAHSDGGGAAFYTRPFSEIPDSKHGWLDWTFKISGGEVTGISGLAYDVHGMSRTHRRLANACLKPFHAHMWN